MDGDAFLRLGYWLWQVFELINPYVDAKLKTKSLPELRVEVEEQYKRLEMYILEKGIIPPMSTVKSQVPNRDAVCVISYVAFGMTVHNSCIMPQTIAKVLGLSEGDYVDGMLRVSAVVNELLVSRHLVFRDDDRGLELSARCKAMVCRYSSPYVFGPTKEEVESQVAKKRTKVKSLAAGQWKYANRFKVKFPKY